MPDLTPWALVVVVLSLVMVSWFSWQGWHVHREGDRALARNLCSAEEEVAELMARVEELSKPREPETPEPITPEQREILVANRCSHCGGSHSIACPRVKRIRFRADNQPLEVEFWPDGQWDTTRVVFVEDFPEVEPPPSTSVTVVSG